MTGDPPERGGQKTILSVQDLRFGYHGQETLKGVSFDVFEGEICALLGPNGSGKTTLQKCLNAILTPHSGSICINGCRLDAMTRIEIARMIAVVPQELATVFPFTALQMVLMGGNVRYGRCGNAKKKDRQQALVLLDELHMADLASRRFNQLSGGERQMVLIARALFQKTPVLLLDEPTSHLDFKRQHLILETVRQITRERKLTTLITLHDPNSAARYCDRLIMLREGCILHQGVCSSVFQVPSLEAVYDMRIHMGVTDNGNRYVMPAC